MHYRDREPLEILALHSDYTSVLEVPVMDDVQGGGVMGNRLEDGCISWR